MTGSREVSVGLGSGDGLERTAVHLLPDPRRVVARLFLPGQEGSAPGVSRAAGVVERCLALSEEQTRELLDEIVANHAERHRSFVQILHDHFAAVAHRVDGIDGLSAQRQQLIGACFTQEYSLEAAALFNPSAVAHPQQDVPAGHLRVVLSARAVGEGHLSSLVFRTGLLGPGTARDATLTMDATARQVSAGTPQTSLIDSARLRHEATVAGVDAESLSFVLAELPGRFTTAELDLALERLTAQRLTRIHSRDTGRQLRLLAEQWYEVGFGAATELSERALMPQISVESHGIEDARFVRFTDDDGTATYLATYTAFNGADVRVRRYQTDDFRTFASSTLTGKAATNKGMALFPRLVAGRHLALSRWDRENVTVASSVDGYHWPEATVVQTPVQPWELIQLGNCGSPIETPQGWLVLTHGVGPMRNYAMGALLLDLDDPTQVIGRLAEPLLSPSEDERDGYVPNVVYSCGALLHEQTLVLPYGCSDSRIRVALLDLPVVLDRLLSSGTAPTGAPSTSRQDRFPPEGLTP